VVLMEWACVRIMVSQGSRPTSSADWTLLIGIGRIVLGSRCLQDANGRPCAITTLHAWPQKRVVLQRQ
jgi:hypothetical protein